MVITEDQKKRYIHAYNTQCKCVLYGEILCKNLQLKGLEQMQIIGERYTGSVYAYVHHRDMDYVLDYIHELQEKRNIAPVCEWCVGKRELPQLFS